MYFGKDIEVLLLPMLMIQTVWITYAVYTISEWLKKTHVPLSPVLQGATLLLFAILPAFMLWQRMSAG
jgi:hypothetical protein